METNTDEFRNEMVAIMHAVNTETYNIGNIVKYELKKFEDPKIQDIAERITKELYTQNDATKRFNDFLKDIWKRK